MAKIYLLPGNKETVDIYARKFWNRTSIHLEVGANYHFKATGKWTDLIIETDADGFQRRYLQPFEAFRRVPTQNWFALIGTVDRMMTTAFLIGKEVTLTPPKSGELVCFANDVSSMYWNNWGRLRLTVTRLT